MNSRALFVRTGRCEGALHSSKMHADIIYALVICHNRGSPLCNLTISLRSNGNAYRLARFLSRARRQLSASESLGEKYLWRVDVLSPDSDDTPEIIRSPC